MSSRFARTGVLTAISALSIGAPAAGGSAPRPALVPTPRPAPYPSSFDSYT